MIERRKNGGAARAGLLLLGGLAVATGWVLTPSSSSSPKDSFPPLTTCAAAATFRNTGGASTNSDAPPAEPSPSRVSKSKAVESVNRPPRAIQGGSKPRPIYKKNLPSPPQQQQRQQEALSHGNAAKAQQHQHQHHQHQHRHPAQSPQHIPFLPYTRLHGSDCRALLNSIENYAEEAKIEELTDALSRLGRLAPSEEALGRIIQDARFHLLLERLADNSHLMPPKWAPFVLSSLTKFSAASPSTAATALLSSPSMQSLLQVLQQRVDVGLPHLSPIALCTVAFAFSRLRYAPRLDNVTEEEAATGAAVHVQIPPPPPLPPSFTHTNKKQKTFTGDSSNKDKAPTLAWWSQFMETAQDRLIEFSPWELSQLIRSLMGQVDAPKEALLTTSFLTLALKCAERQFFTTFTARDLEGLATSLSKLPPHLYKPSPRFFEALVKAADTHLSSGFRPPTLARLLHALSRLEGCSPDHFFLQRAEQACAASASKWDQASIALVSQAWSWMKYQPGEATLSALLTQAKGMLLDGSLTPLNAGTLIQSLGELRRCPDEGWLRAFREAMYPKLGQMQGKDLNFILKGLAKLNWCPGDAFLAALLQHMQPHLEQFNGSDLQFTLSSLVGLHFLPSAGFVKTFQTRFSSLLRMEYVSPRDLSIVLWSFAALEIPDSHLFLIECMQTAVRQLEGERGRWEGLENGGTERWALTARVRQLRQVYLYAQSMEGKEGGREGGLANEFRRMGLMALLEEGLRHANDEMVLAKAHESGFHREVAEVLHSLGATTRRSVDCFVLDLLIEPREGGRERGVEEGGGRGMMMTAEGGAVVQGGREEERAMAAVAAAAGGGGGEGCALEVPIGMARLPTPTNDEAVPAPPAPPAQATPAAPAAPAALPENKPLVLLLHGPSRFLRGQTGVDSPKLEAGTAFKEKILQTQSPHRFARVASLDVWEWARQKTQRAKVELLRAKIGRTLLESYLSKQPGVATASAGGGGAASGVVA